MSNKPYFPSLTAGGIDYSFQHLEPFTFSFESLSARRELRVRVRYSNHCFTHAYDAQSAPYAFPILLDQGKRERVFCPVRYSLSMGLNSVINDMNHAKVKVYETQTRRNWTHSIAVDAPAGPYHLFFNIEKAAKDEKRYQDINMFIESAYPEQPVGDAPAVIGRIGFQLLCTNVYLNKPTSTKR